MKYPLLAYLDVFSYGVPLIAGFYRWKFVSKNLFSSALFFTFTAVGAITEFVTFWMSARSLSNLWILHIYNLLQYVLLLTMIAQWMDAFQEDKNERSINHILKPSTLRWSIIAFTVFWLISKWTIEEWNRPATYTQTVATLVLITLSLFVLFQLVYLHPEGNSSLAKSFRFWICLGLLIYFAGSGVHFLLIPWMTNLGKELIIGLWSIHWGLNFLVNIIYAIGFLCLTRPQMA